MNYGALVAAIKSYTESDFSTTDVNLFITQAEESIYNSMQIVYLRTILQVTIQTNNNYLTCTAYECDTCY